MIVRKDFNDILKEELERQELENMTREQRIEFTSDKILIALNELQERVNEAAERCIKEIRGLQDDEKAD